MQEIQFYLVDAFSDKNFGGNAAAVCPLSEWLADDVLLNCLLYTSDAADEQHCVNPEGGPSKKK